MRRDPLEERFVLPRFNPDAKSLTDKKPVRLVEYVAVRRGDRVARPGLALLMQDWLCRRFARTRLHTRIAAAFMDTPRSHGDGFRRLRALLARRPVREVVVARLDRLPATRRRLFGRLAVRVVSASEPNARRVSQADRLADIRRTIGKIFAGEDRARKGGRR